MAKLDVIAQQTNPISAVLKKVEVEDSDEIVGEKIWWMFYGPPGHGKTVFGASAASNFPEKLPPETKVKLTGVLWWLFDKGGTDSLTHLNLSVPVINMSACVTKAQLRTSINDAAKKTVDLGVETIIIDTFSQMDKVLTAHLGSMYESTKELYKNLGVEHQLTLNTLRELPVNVIFLCHSKAKWIMGASGEFRDAAETKAQATETPGDHNIVVDLGGATKEVLRNSCSLMAPVIASRLGNRPLEYAVYPSDQGFAGFEVKTRYRCFQPKEKPNLYGMMQRVKGAK